MKYLKAKRGAAIVVTAGKYKGKTGCFIARNHFNDHNRCTAKVFLSLFQRTFVLPNGYVRLVDEADYLPKAVAPPSRYW